MSDLRFISSMPPAAATTGDADAPAAPRARPAPGAHPGQAGTTRGPRAYAGMRMPRWPGMPHGDAGTQGSGPADAAPETTAPDAVEAAAAPWVRQRLPRTVHLAGRVSPGLPVRDLAGDRCPPSARPADAGMGSGEHHQGGGGYGGHGQQKERRDEAQAGGPASPTAPADAGTNNRHRERFMRLVAAACAAIPPPPGAGPDQTAGHACALPVHTARPRAAGIHQQPTDEY